jgi:hypothetical protein
VTRARRDGLYLLLLGSAIFVALGAALERGSPFAAMDFKVVYASARCVLEHCDPYNASDLGRVFKEEGGSRAADSPKVLSTVSVYVYPPNAFAITAPFAVLPFGAAHAVWMLLTIGSLIFASYLMWNLGADYAPIVSGGLVFLLLANSELLAIVGNAAGIVVSLCVVAVWCFLRNRHAGAGVFCLAVSLVLKPQDAGFVWLFFLFAGGVYRKRAWQTLAVAAALSLPAVLWVWHVAPHWAEELRANLAAVSARGGNNDPGPSSSGAHGLGMVTDLQAVFSVFRDDPRIYNPLSYLVCAALLFPWLARTVRSRLSPANAWFALAVIAPLTMLPVYHRQYDAKLLLLAIPACAMLWAEGGSAGKWALALTSAGILLNGDILWAVLIGVINSLHLPANGLSAQLLTAIQVFPSPLILLAMSIFYLWIYLRRGAGSGERPAASVSPDQSSARRPS